MAEESKFGSGFVLGSIIGAGAVFLLGTKKGKKLLKTLTEEGFDSVSELTGLFDGELEGENPRGQKMTPKKLERKIIKKVNEIKKSEPVQRAIDKIEEIKELDSVQDLEERIEPVVEKMQESAEDAVNTVSKKAKRLFRGIKRK